MPLIGCLCGYEIEDTGAKIACKARFIADREWDKLWDLITQDGRDWTNPHNAEGLFFEMRALFRECFQCPACGRVLIDGWDHRLNVFAPELNPPVKDLLAPRNS